MRNMISFTILLIAAQFSLSLCGPIFKDGYTLNTPENIALLESNDYKQNAEELSGQFEGDMILNPDQFETIFGDAQDGFRNGLIAEKYRWKDKRIPYTLNGNFSAEQKAYIVKGLAILESVSCLSFPPRTNEVDYIEVVAEPTGCHTKVGRQSGVQRLNLQHNKLDKGCFKIGTIMHEFLHALGFYHMQSATERDDYVRIEWDFIKPGKENNFKKREADKITNFGVKYDYRSVLHYSAYAFSLNGQATIVPTDSSMIEVIGQRANLSPSDIIKLNAMYC